MSSLPAGLPAYEGGVAACRAMVEGGVDGVEVGLPYSDPLIDGPTIQEAVDLSLPRAFEAEEAILRIEALLSSSRVLVEHGS